MTPDEFRRRAGALLAAGTPPDVVLWDFERAGTEVERRGEAKSKVPRDVAMLVES